MKDTNIKHINFDTCTTVVKENMKIKLLDNGKLLDVSICLKNVCSDRHIMVGVLICYDNNPYALKTREVYTGKCCKCCSCCCCLKDIELDGFEFVFPPQVCTEEIIVKVISHYTC